METFLSVSASAKMDLNHRLKNLRECGCNSAPAKAALFNQINNKMKWKFSKDSLGLMV